MDTTELKEIAVASLQAEEKYQKAFWSYVESIEPLSDERFWELVPEFVNEIRCFYFGYGRTDGVKDAAREFVRKTVVNQATWTLEETIQFAKTWREVKSRLYKPLFDVVEGYSDDSYSDLRDALPCLGKDFINRCLNEEIAKKRFIPDAKERISDMAAEYQVNFESLCQFILQGENYMSSALEDAAKRYFATEALIGVEDPYADEDDL
jgi:hypothetical protein